MSSAIHKLSVPVQGTDETVSINLGKGTSVDKIICQLAKKYEGCSLRIEETYEHECGLVTNAVEFHPISYNSKREIKPVCERDMWAKEEAA